MHWIPAVSSGEGSRGREGCPYRRLGVRSRVVSPRDNGNSRTLATLDRGSR